MTCPHPAKRAYGSQVLAVEAMASVMRRRRARYRFVRSYLCPCGMWHLTSKPAKRR